MTVLHPRPDDDGRVTVTDDLVATLADYWGERVRFNGAPLDPITLFAETGEITAHTAAAFQRCLTALEAATADSGDVGWASQVPVSVLLAYVTHHGPRGPEPGWQALRRDAAVCELFTRALPRDAGDPVPPPEAHDHAADLVAVLVDLTGGLDQAHAALGAIVTDLYDELHAHPTLRAAFQPPRASKDYLLPENRQGLEVKLGETLAPVLQGTSPRQQARYLRLVHRVHHRLEITTDEATEFVLVVLKVLSNPRFGLPVEVVETLRQRLAPYVAASVGA